MTPDHVTARRRAQADLRGARRSRQEAFLRECFRSGTQKEAAAALGISIQHLKNTLRDLYDRLGVDSAVEAAYVLWLAALWEEDVGEGYGRRVTLVPPR